MVRVRAGARTITTKYNKVWPKNWDQMSKLTSIPLDSYMRRLLKYYPKTFRPLKPLSQLFSDIGPVVRSNNYELNCKGIYRQIVKKYKSDFYRHTKISNDPMNLLLDRSLRSLQSLIIHTSQHQTILQMPDQSLKKVMTHNRNIKKIKISGQQWCSNYMVKCLKYLKSLEALEMIDLPFLPIEEYNHIISSKSLKTKLQRVSITGVRDKKSDLEEDKDYFKKFVDYLLSLPNLKQLRFDGNMSQESDANDIPFETLQKRGINYDLRVFHSGENIVFSKDNAQSLKELDTLGVNLKKTWSNRLGKGVCWKETLAVQTTSRHLLFISVFPFQNTDLTELFQTCRYIATLDLILPKLDIENINFIGVRDLCNLRNLFLYIDDVNPLYQVLFENLAICVQQHKTLDQLVIHLLSQTPIEKQALTLSPFFDACLQIVTKFVLELTISIDEGDFKTDYIYKALEKSPHLTHLALSFHPNYNDDYYVGDFLLYHFPQIQRILEIQSLLKEFDLYMSQYHESANIDFSNAKSLEKLYLGIDSSFANTNSFRSCFDLPNLINLQLAFHHFPSYHVLDPIKQGLKKLNKLEILKVKPSFTGKKSTGDVKSECNEIMRQNTNLKFLANGNPSAFSTVQVFARNGYWEDLDSFFLQNRDTYDIPCLLNYDIHHLT